MVSLVSFPSTIPHIPSPPSPAFGLRYTIYLSFRGGDIHANFKSQLQAAFSSARIDTTISVGILPEEIEREQVKAMETLRISLIIFSRNYAASRLCLDELVTILDCRKKEDMIALPIFFDVHPSHIRNQTGHVARALARHEKRHGHHQVKKWRAALKEVSSLCGWDFHKEYYNKKCASEYMLITKVAEHLLNIGDRAHLNISVYPLGYDTCDEYLNIFLQVGSDDVLVVGICGQSGMGKTAMAKDVYCRISHKFEGSSFLKGIGQHSRQQANGLAQLQETLLCDVLSERIKITNISMGMDMIREKLSDKRVVIVLDDVDDMDQLCALAGSRDWYGAGSKIIILTRNVKLLEAFKVDEIIMARGRRPPSNLLVQWEQFRQSCREIAGLKEYIRHFKQLTNEKLRFLEDCLSGEQQKNAIQAQMISELKKAQAGDCASSTSRRKLKVIFSKTDMGKLTDGRMREGGETSPTCLRRSHTFNFNNSAAAGCALQGIINSILRRAHSFASFFSVVKKKEL